jgi:hypothetical protein
MHAISSDTSCAISLEASVALKQMQKAPFAVTTSVHRSTAGFALLVAVWPSTFGPYQTLLGRQPLANMRREDLVRHQVLGIAGPNRALNLNLLRRLRSKTSRLR